MTIPQLGTLSQASLRDAWDHEAHSFTPWLAEHLDLLAETIGMPLELTGREVAVEQFSADILARNPQDDSVVLIENQLEWTDHKHLGQIMTYLAGLDAQAVVWIAADFQEAHISAVKWLNEHTVDPFAFFAVRVKVVRIGDSPLAPVFEVLGRPSGWERQLQAIATDSNLSELGQFRKDFWTHLLNRYPEDSVDGAAGGKSLRQRKIPSLPIVIRYFIGKKTAEIFFLRQGETTGAEAYAVLEPYASRLAEITEAEIGSPEGHRFFWDKVFADATDRTKWDELTDWLHDRLTVYTSVLQEAG